MRFRSYRRSHRGVERNGSASPLLLLGTLLVTLLVGWFGGRSVAATGGTSTSNASDPETVVARVNGEAITRADLERSLARLHGSATAGQREDFDLERLMWRTVNDVLIAREARALGLDQDEAVIAEVERYRERLARAELEREAVSDPGEPTEAEVSSLFEERYRRVTLQVVTADLEADARAILALLRDGVDMETMARERSVDPYSQRGGHVVEVLWSDLQPEIAELTATLGIGELGGPVRTDLGWSVIRLSSVSPPDPNTSDELKSSLEQLIRFRKKQVLRGALAEQARAAFDVTVDDRVLASLNAEKRPDGRLVPRFDDSTGVVVRITRRDGKPEADQFELRITASELRQALLARWGGVRSQEAAVAAAPIVLQRMLDERLLLAEALARGYNRAARVERAVRAFESALIIPRGLEELVGAEVTEVSADELAEYYENHKEEYGKPPRIEVGQVTVATLDEGEKVAELLRQGTDLAWLAQRYSIDRFTESGGVRGTLEREAGALDARLLASDAGDVLDPVGVSGNYVVFKVLSREEQGLYSFDEVTGNVRQDVLAAKMRQAIASVIETLRARSTIEIDHQLLSRIVLAGRREEQNGSDEGVGPHAH